RCGLGSTRGAKQKTTGRAPAADPAQDAEAMDLAAIMMALASAEGQADPYPLYSALHGLGEAAQLAPGRVVVAGYDAVNEVLRDPSFTVSDAAALDQGFAGWRAHPALAGRARSI